MPERLEDLRAALSRPSPDAPDVFAEFASACRIAAEQLAKRSTRVDASAAGTVPAAMFEAARRLGPGVILDLPRLPEGATLVLAALRDLARGRRVVVVDFRSWTGEAKALAAAVREMTGLTVQVLGGALPAPYRKEDYEADLVLTDILRLGTDLHRTPALFSDRPTVLLAANIDLCLYDYRLLVFENGTFRVAAAVEHSEGAAPEWYAHENLFDWAREIRAFSAAAGIGVDIEGTVLRELATVYGMRADQRARHARLRPMPALIFATIEEKIAAVLRDIGSVRGDVLIFSAWGWAARMLRREIGRSGMEAAIIRERKELLAFLEARTRHKRLAIFTGLPAPDWPMPVRAEDIGVGIFAPYPFEHHHQKIRRFCAENLGSRYAPCLYYMTGDADEIWTFAGETRLARAFRYLERAEKAAGIRRVRAWFGARILDKCYRTRRRFWHEDAPVFTYVHGPEGRVGRRESGKRPSKFDAPCYCGSGKPFRECHGKALFVPSSPAKPRQDGAAQNG